MTEALNFRVDFRFVNISGDDGNPEMVAVLDPERYEFGQLSGEGGWFDRLDERNLFFPVRIINELLAKSANLPIGDLPPLISDTDAYIRGRDEAIMHGIREGQWDGAFRNAANEELNAGGEVKTHFVIASIDLVGSTELSQFVDGLQFSRIMQTYSKEVARLCALFHGRPLKFMGDGGILYFPFGSINRKNDLAIDCALSLRDLVLGGLNLALADLGLPQLSCRIGIDSGEAYVTTIGDRATTNNVDIIGEVVGIATKVEKVAGVNGICLGESVVVNTHTMWLRHVSRIAEPDNWPYRNANTGRPYGIFRLDIPFRGAS